MTWTLVHSVLAVSTVVAMVLFGLAMGLLTTLRNSNKDLRDRVGDLEKDRDEDEKHIAQLEADNTVLKRIATGEVQWQALSDLLDQHHKESMTAWNEIKAAISATHTAVERDASRPDGSSAGPSSGS